uniref:tRNA (adenine(58)-N(1))-methyltransferase non-catalytic subunit TRM6 n=1 Tax=Erpetoichthys calabaricus TaxID=27687 RepID=A0A8C4T3E7_ERPCA
MEQEKVVNNSQPVIKELDYVVLKREDIYKAVQIQPKRKIIFEKQWLFLDNAVGQPYGTTFDVIAGGVLQAQKPRPAGSLQESKEAGVDNRNIVDDGRSQKLTRDDIETLKEQGLKGQDIVQQLIDNSTTFRDKTEFAQEKYIKKKKKKYENIVTIVKPSGRVLAQMYHGREPGKICHLRYDTLGQMLTLGNIHAGNKVIVFETCAGLVLGAVMERLGGYGSVIQMCPGGGPVRAATDSFGFPEHFYEMLHEFPLSKVNSLLDGSLVYSVEEKSEAEQTNTLEDCMQTKEEIPDQCDLVNERNDQDEELMETSSREEQGKQNKGSSNIQDIKVQDKRVKQEEKQRKEKIAAALLREKNADGLVIASRFQPSPVVLSLLKFVAPSRPFVIYSQHKEPLIECYTKLRERGGVISLRLSETWLRQYQVLPNRTHPKLLMSGGGGYILSGITVEMDAEKPSETEKTGEPAGKRLKIQHAQD